MPDRRSGRFLMPVIDAGGTLPPALGLAAELVRRGHWVDVLADPTAERSAVAAGCRFSSWQSAPRVDSIPEQTALIAAMASSPHLDRYAKAPEHRYDAALRRAVLDGARREHAVEIRRGLAWLDDAAARFPLIAALLPTGTSP